MKQILGFDLIFKRISPKILFFVFISIQDDDDNDVVFPLMNDPVYDAITIPTPPSTLSHPTNHIPLSFNTSFSSSPATAASNLRRFIGNKEEKKEHEEEESGKYWILFPDALSDNKT